MPSPNLVRLPASRLGHSYHGGAVKLPAKLIWGTGLLVPTLVVGAVMAGLKDFDLLAVILYLTAALGIWANWSMLRAIEGVMSRRLAVKSSETQPLARSASGLLGLLIPAGDLFDDGFGWAVMLGVLVVLLGILQYVKPAPPGLLMFFFGYRPHTVAIEAGTVELWLKGKARLSPGDDVHAAEPTQRLWIGTIADV